MRIVFRPSAIMSARPAWPPVHDFLAYSARLSASMIVDLPAPVSPMTANRSRFEKSIVVVSR